MKRLLLCFYAMVVAVGLGAAGIVGSSHANMEPSPGLAAEPAELAYLKQVNQWRPPSDPQLLFLLMGQFASAGRYQEGIAYFSDLLSRFGPELGPPQRAQYLTAIAALRAGRSDDVFVLKRMGWVRDTLAMLDEAKQLSHGEMFVARWMSGIVRAKVPRFFGEGDAALADLLWCVEHASKAPDAGWLREVYAKLADVYRERGNEAEAERFQSLSGYPPGKREVLFTTNFGEEPGGGHTFTARTIREAVPGTVYVLSGFEFTEYYFVVSADRKELIAIDAGTRPDSARAAYEALKERVPTLPMLTTVFVTHAHWDHVGGHQYFRSLNPSVRFYGRGNYAEEQAHNKVADPAMLALFFGSQFHLDDVLSYKPDTTIDRPTDVVVGGTHFRVLPARGGETDDALLVQMPDEGVLFVGDILMPYLGAPFVPEGSIDGLLQSIDQVGELHPRQLLHGHEPLTRVFSTTAMLGEVRIQLAWLRDEILRMMTEGAERGAIQQANLVPPTLSASTSNVHLAYLLMRENVINRVFQQNSGYWQNGLRGLDALTSADFGAALSNDFGLSEEQIASAAQRMIKEGKLEMAATVMRWSKTRYPGSASIEATRKLAYLKLMEKYQAFNPFKFIVYGGQAAQSVRQMNLTPSQQ